MFSYFCESHCSSPAYKMIALLWDDWRCAVCQVSYILQQHQTLPLLQIHNNRNKGAAISVLCQLLYSSHFPGHHFGFSFPLLLISAFLWFLWWCGILEIIILGKDSCIYTQKTMSLGLDFCPIFVCSIDDYVWKGSIHLNREKFLQNKWKVLCIRSKRKRNSGLKLW